MSVRFNIAFYVHHHGSGHFTRVAQILKKLKGYDITLLGSNLHPFVHLLPENTGVIHLPADTRSAEDSNFQNGSSVEALHYAPLNVKGISDRVNTMTAFFRQKQPLLLVVDVSVEVTLLARLAGVPTVVMRQHGIREDLPHLMAYQSAALLLAPFSKSISPKSAQWIIDKTCYTGGFSRFSKESNSTEKSKHVAIVVGSGGTSIDAAFIEHLAGSCKDFYFHVIGRINGECEKIPNVEFYGHLDEPKAILDLCRIVIGNTGHNTVMEMASLQKRFIGIPEVRPFEEQLDKANAIAFIPGVQIVSPQSLYRTGWHLMLNELEAEVPDWRGIVSVSAIDDAASAIVATGKKLFS